MSPSRRRLLCSLASLLIPLSAGWAQESLPHLGYAYPAGGQQGTSFQITVGGQYLDNIGRITFSGVGVEARKVEGIKPMTEADVRVLRDRLTQLGRNQKELATRREMAEIGRKLARYMAAALRRQTHPAISETVELQVTIAADAEPGLREMRLETARGVSNPLRFCVGRLPEFREQDPELVTDIQGWEIPLRYPATVTTDITLPATVNGQLIPREPDALRYGGGFTPGDADRYRFQAQKGQTLVIAASARELIPYLADAVPGWFQATLTLYDAQGREVAFGDDYRFQPDPVLVFKVPVDGAYVVEIKDAISRGRPDFVYRISIGELPFITGIFPLGGRVGERTVVKVVGHNLPSDTVAMDGRDRDRREPRSAPAGHDTVPVAVATPVGWDSVPTGLRSNTVPFAIDTLPELLEKEPNEATAPQPITLPTIVNGRIDRTGDWDVFRFTGRAGQQVVAEVVARRLESPMDSVLELTDAAGKRLAFNDDHEDKADALKTHHADSLIRFTLPADGTYCVRLGEAQRRGGPEFAYRLRISPPRPDFALRVVPSCINASSWRLTPVTVFALRQDGFDGEIALSFKDNPEGVVLIGGTVPAGQDRVRVTLSTASWAAVEPIRLCLEGRATINGEEVVRQAVAADDVMQAFFYRHLVPAESLKLVLADSGRFRPEGPRPQPPPEQRRNYQPQAAVLSEQPARIPAGGTAEVQIRGPWGGWGEVELELSDPPEGIVIEKIASQDRNLTITLRADAEKAKPGLRGNLIVNTFRKRTETNKEGKTREYRSFYGPLPAIRFEVVKP